MSHREILPSFPAGRRVELPGRGTTFIREVAGPEGAPTVILLHGWTATGGLNWSTKLRRDWTTPMEELSRNYRVIAIDHRGHGRGISSQARFQLTDCADDVAALMDVLGIKKAILAGYSMGGPIAQLTAKRHPDKVAGLVLCATAARFPQSVPVAMPLHLAAAFLGKLPRILRASALPFARLGLWGGISFADEMGRSDPQKLYEAGVELTRFDSRNWLGSLRAPTAVVLTTNDQLVPPKYQKEMAQAIPGSTIFPVQGDHLAAAFSPEFGPAVGRAVGEVVRQIGERAVRHAVRPERRDTGPALGTA